MREIITNQRFDDIYFSPDDGMAETQHVFIDGNNLRARWQNLSAEQRDFTIFEAGFGTGLNFLCACKAFDENAPKNAHLHYIAVEKYPLSIERIEKALSQWDHELGFYLKKLIKRYPLRIQTTHRIEFADNISLTLMLGDINEMLPKLNAPMGIDAWLLDGFAPSKNPEMWTQTLFENMRRLSRSEASVSSFTAAGAVRRGLSDCCFEIEKVRGFGRKREMIKGQFKTPDKSADNKFKQRSETKKIAIIGGGLAGTSCAYVLGKGGHDCTIFERGDDIASGASGNAAGLYNPRFFAETTPPAQFYGAAFARACDVFSDLAASNKEIGFRPCGALHLINTQEKKKRFEKMTAGGMWHEKHMCLLDAKAASEIAGVSIDKDCLFLPQSGAISPQKLCHAYAKNVRIIYGASVFPEKTKKGWQIGEEEFDIVIVAAGAACLKMDACKNLPIHTVRGQITHMELKADASSWKTALCYGGYVLPLCEDGRFVVGSSFQKWRDDTNIDPQDNEDNLKKLSDNIPSLSHDIARNAKITDSRAGLRTVSKDHLPVIGEIAGQADLYVSSAHGSHGILSSLMGAIIVRDLIEYGGFIGGEDIANSVAPSRFA